MNVYDDAHALANSIKASEEYKEYKALKDQVEANPEIKKMLDDFQEKSMEFQLKQMSGEAIDDAAMASIQQLYAIVMQDPMAANFMQAQMRFSIMMKDVYDILGEAAQ